MSAIGRSSRLSASLLSSAVGSPIGASTLQLGIGAALLLALTAAVGTLGAFGALSGADPAHLWGGIGSALYITAGILLFPRLGALVAVGLFIAGQMGASLLLDGFGWLGVERAARPVGDRRCAGGRGRHLDDRPRSGRRRAARAGLAQPERLGRARARRGGGAARTGAVNAQLRAEGDAPITVGAFSFLVATAAMAVVLAAAPAFAQSGHASAARLGTVPWWGWLGGACGATYVTSVFVLIPEIGVAPTVALTVAGQPIASVFVDRYGLLRLPRRPISRRRLTGVVLLLVGVLLIQLA